MRKLQSENSKLCFHTSEQQHLTRGVSLILSLWGVFRKNWIQWDLLFSFKVGITITMDEHGRLVFCTSHMSWMDEVTVQSIVELEPHTVIYNIQDYNRNTNINGHHWWMLLVWSFLINWWTFCLKIEGLHDSHEPSTCFMKSDWLEWKAWLFDKM